MKHNRTTKHSQVLQSTTDVAFLHNAMSSGNRRTRKLAIARLRELTIELARQKNVA